MLTPDKTTFRRAQTDSPDTLTLFFSVDGTDALGRPTSSDWVQETVTFTEAEAEMIAGLVSRARKSFCDRVNASLVAES